MKLFKKLAVASASLVTSLSMLVVQASAAPTVVYNNIADPTPGNVPSLGNEAYQGSELGGQIELAGTNRSNPKVTVLMSSWGCESGNWFNADCVTTPGATFSHPITLNVYEVGVGNVPGSLLATSTKTFEIPYRPSTHQGCTGGRWSSDGGTTCFNGLATPIDFELAGLTLPNKVIVSVAYNTSHYGYTPMTELSCYTESGGCGYDSLNVGTQTSLSVGAQPIADSAYFNSSTPSQYCDANQGAGTFRLDAGCWSGFQPSFKVEASAPAPTNKDQCKGNGWKGFGGVFKNQGDCVSYVSTGGRNKPALGTF